MVPVLVAAALVLPLLGGVFCLLRARREAPDGRRWRRPRARWLAIALAALVVLVFVCDVARDVELLPAALLVLFWSVPVLATAWCPWLLLAFPVSWIAGGLGGDVVDGFTWERVRRLECPVVAAAQDARVGVRPWMRWHATEHAFLHPLWREVSEADSPFMGVVVLVDGAPHGTEVRVSDLFVIDAEGNRRPVLLYPEDPVLGRVDIGRTSLRDAPDGAPAALLWIVGSPLVDGGALEADVEADLPGGVLRRHVVQPIVLSTARRFGWRPARE